MYKATVAEFDFNRSDCDVWVFNETISGNKLPRADAVFQMHRPVIWRSKTNRNDPGHYDWLQNNRTLPVYMIDKYDDVPMSVKYPMDEVLKAIPQAYRYFTSSVSYALALAIYQGYERIEVYGVEMETETEYGHQRDGVTYWVGVAQGRGIEVDYHSINVLKSPLYGFDGDTTLPIELFQERVNILQRSISEALDRYKERKEAATALIEAYRKDAKTNLENLSSLVVAQGQAAHDYNLVDGAIQVNQRHIKACEQMLKETGNYFLSRQIYESEKSGAVTGWQAQSYKINEAATALEVKEKELREASNKDRRNVLCDEFLKAVETYAHTVGKAGLLTGIGQESNLLCTKHDQMLRMFDGGRSVKLQEAECAPA